MGIKATYLTDKNGNKVYPYAHADATYDSQGVTVGKRLETITNELEEVNKAIENIDIGEDNVQSDWNVTDTTSDAFIKNKPTIPSIEGLATTKYVDEAVKNTESFVTDKIAEIEIPSLDGYAKTEDIEEYDDTALSNRVKTIEDDYLTSKDKTELSNSIADVKTETEALIPTSLPAEGGNADTVNNHTVNIDVPADAKFTDTVYEHPDSGVTVGTYKSVTVNAQGHVTSGSNPTTLAGYGITDAEPKGTANTVVSNHNTSTTAHNDIRDLIIGLTNRLNALADSDDETLDQMSEIVAYIKANKTLIDSITTSKVNVSDIVNDLTTNVSNKPLSASQGVVIKGLIDALQTEVDTKVDKIDGKGLSTNDYTTTEKTKLSGIATGAEVNQNAFSNVVVGSTTISADAKTDSLTLAGSNVTLTPDATNDKVTIGITKANVTSALGYTPPTTNTTYGVATSSALGLVKSGTDITVDSSGNVSVNDDSHNHTIANVDGLQTELDSKAVVKTLTSEDLNDIVKEGFYNAGGGNTVTNKPSGIEHFGLYVIHRASGAYYTQVLIGNNTKSYRRHCDNGTWGSWSEDKLTDTTYTLSSFGVTATKDELNKLDGLTATTTELNYVDGVTSNIQTQLNGKSSTSHTHSSYVNQNAFSNVTVGSTTIAADTATDTLTLVAGSNVTLTPDATNDKITISSTNTNTHYTSKNVVGSSTATSNTTSALTNGNVYLNSVENGAVTSSHKISGSGATTVTTDASGNIVISSTGTNVAYGTSASALGTSSAGSATTVSRSDHVHALPALTSCTGTLTVAKGGTGATTAKGAEYNILGSMAESTNAITDDSQVVFKYSSPSATQGVTLWKKASLIWNYIKGKADSIYLKLTGGTISNTASRALNIKRNATGAANIQFENSNGILGAIGMSSVNGGVVRYQADSSATESYTLLDTGNYKNTVTPANIGAYSSSTSRTANTVLASPNGSAGAATFRSLVSADLPTVPASKGGSGKTTLVDSANAYINALTSGSSVPTDDDYMITQYASGGTTTTTYHRRKMSVVWEYFKSKAASVFLQKSGDTMNTDAYLSFPTSNDARQLLIGKSQIKNVVPSGGWAMGTAYFKQDGTTSLGNIGAYGTGDTVNYFYVGGTYNVPLLKVTPEGVANAKELGVNNKVNLAYNSTTNSLDFNFL